MMFEGRLIKRKLECFVNFIRLYINCTTFKVMMEFGFKVNSIISKNTSRLQISNCVTIEDIWNNLKYKLNLKIKNIRKLLDINKETIFNSNKRYEIQKFITKINKNNKTLNIVVIFLSNIEQYIKDIINILLNEIYIRYKNNKPLDTKSKNLIDLILNENNNEINDDILIKFLIDKPGKKNKKEGITIFRISIANNNILNSQNPDYIFPINVWFGLESYLKYLSDYLKLIINNLNECIIEFKKKIFTFKINQYFANNLYTHALLSKGVNIKYILKNFNSNFNPSNKEFLTDLFIIDCYFDKYILKKENENENNNSELFTITELDFDDNINFLNINEYYTEKELEIELNDKLNNDINYSFIKKSNFNINNIDSSKNGRKYKGIKKDIIKQFIILRQVLNHFTSKVYLVNELNYC
ncbi:hypothetical protein ABK040_005724 [Willaertia magna]